MNLQNLGDFIELYKKLKKYDTNIETEINRLQKKSSVESQASSSSSSRPKDLF